MCKYYFSVFIILLCSTFSFAQGTESFANINPAGTATPMSYIARTWTGDNGLSWTASDARVDGPTDGAIIGITGKFIVIRQSTGKVTCNNIPNGCGTLSFDYARAYTGTPLIGLYINGIQQGSNISVTSNTAQTASFSVNVNGIFNLEIRQITSGTTTRVAIDNITWTSNNATPCADPADQPTNLILSATSNTVNGSFTLIPQPTTIINYLLVRSTDAALTALPMDGTSYAAGQIIGGGNGTVVGTLTDGTFTNAVSPATTYYYFVFAINDQSCSGGPNYNQTAPLTRIVTTPALAACTTPVTPTALNLIASNTSVSGSFTGSGASKYIVIISTSSPLTALPANGTVYANGQIIGNGKVVSYGNATSFLASGLSVSTPYYIYVFAANDACTGEPFYSNASLNGSTSTTNTGTGIPAGYYDAATGLSCNFLKNALSTIAANGQVTLNYSTIDNAGIPEANVISSDDGLRQIMWDIYSNNTTGAEPFEYNGSQITPGGFCGASSPASSGVCWNKEHTFPKSWFGSQLPAYADLFLVRPTDIKINSARGNIPYSLVGASTTYTFPATTATYPGVPILDKVGPSTATGVSAVSSFEPNDGVKGDIARGYFYIMTRYQANLSSWVNTYTTTAVGTVVDGSTGSGTYPSFQLPYLKMLYNWHIADPVDAREVTFNNNVYGQQNNRNPFIDHPEYVAMIWQCTGVLPVNIVDFTAQKNKETVLLKWYATLETAFKKYEIERSTDAIAFNKIGEVEGKNLANYSFADVNLPAGAIVYYRLKMIDADGKFNNSKIIAVRLNKNLSNAIVYPNPSYEILNIKLFTALQENSFLQVIDISGRVIKTRFVNTSTFNIAVDVKSLSPGRYFIKINNSKEVINQSFVVIK